MTPLKTAFLAASAIAAIGLPAAAAAPLGQTKVQVTETDDQRGADGIEAALREAGYGDTALAALVETQRYTSPVSGRTYVTLEQRVGDRLVHASYVRGVIEADGTLSRVMHRIADLQTLRVPVAADISDAALSSVAGFSFGLPAPRVVGSEGGNTWFEQTDGFQEQPTATDVLIADEDGSLSAAKLVQAWAKEGNELVHTLVAEDGRVLEREGRTSQDSYVAYATNPGAANARVMQGSQADRTASPRGWLGADPQSSNFIRGNNAEAYADKDNNNAADGGGARVTNGTFGRVANLNGPLDAQQNEDAAVQNLFYHVNVIHDRLYKHGFTERAGNFQRDNFGRGGTGGDQVRAEVLDGMNKGNANNANFATPMARDLRSGDGGQPRMQMYRWNRNGVDRAGSLDADIVWHEYGHGMIWRMVTDMDWPISWAVNEGFADALAVVATGDDRVGEWAVNSANGIRSARYGATGKRLGSYARGGKGKAHANGEIYGAAMWAVREEFRRAGRSDDMLMGLMVDGLSNTVPRPTFLDMRDGLLAAGSPADDCRVWRGFAKVGMGEGARMSWSGSKTAPSVSVRESFAVPASCSAAPPPAPAPAPPPDAGSSVVSGLTGSAARQSTGRWTAQARITIREGNQVPKRTAVEVRWSTGQVNTCHTDGAGRCDVTLYKQLPTAPTAVATVLRVGGRTARAANGELSVRIANPYGGTQDTPPLAGRVVTAVTGSAAKQSTGRWTAQANVTIRDGGQVPKRSKVEVQWSTGQLDTCYTDGAGRCDVTLYKQLPTAAAATATVVRIDGRAAQAANGALSVRIANPYGGSTGSAPTGRAVTALSGSAVRQSTGRWTAQAKVTIRDGGQVPKRSKVEVRWNTGEVHACYTDGAGRCDVTLYRLKKTAPTVEATVIRIEGRPAQSASGSLSVRIGNPY